MSWFSKFFDHVAGGQTIDWTFVDEVADPGLGISGQPIQPDECYVEIFLESLRLKQARRFATAFHGAVYSFFRLSQEGSEDADIAALSKPTRLADLDSANLDRVITVSLQMMGAIPWRGGTLGVELGLFSIKKGNLLTPVLDYVTKVSEQGGVSFIGQIKPFVPLVTQGMDLIAGQTADAVIEVAVDTDMQLQQSRICAVIATPRGSIDSSRLTLDASDRKLLLDGRPLEEGYCVFSIRRSDRKADYGAIPDIKASFASVISALRGDEGQAKTALAAFRRTVLLSPDLITTDKDRLIEKANSLYRSVFSERLAAAVKTDAESGIGVRELADLDLYGNGKKPL